MFIDTHAHLTMPEFSDRTLVIERAKAEKVEAIVNVSFDLDSSRQSLALAKQYPGFIFAAVGIHPHDSDKVNEESINEIRNMALDTNVVAVGEVGLDYFRSVQPRPVQQAALIRFLALAQEIDRPIIIHAREASEDIVRIIKQENRGRLRGVFHCFAGDQNLIDFALSAGFFISFAGMVTFKKAEDARENLKKVPLSNLLLETDCPYLAPDPFRGQRNEPAYIKIIAQKIAEVKGVILDAVAVHTSENARKLFKI